MSIQDDIFDINSKLKRNYDKEAFERICTWAFNMETQIEVLEKREEQLIITIKVLKQL